MRSATCPRATLRRATFRRVTLRRAALLPSKLRYAFLFCQRHFILFFPGVICLAVPTALRASKEAMSSTVTSHEKRPESRFQCSGYFKGTNSQPAQTKSLERLALARSSECSSGRGFLRRTPSIRSGSRVGDDAIHC